MNKSAKKLSALLAVLMMSSTFAASVSAIDTNFIKTSGTSKTETVINEAEEAGENAVAGNVLKTSGWVKTDAPILENSAKNIYIKPSTTSTVKKTIYKNEKPFTIDGTYYSKADAEKELQSYFAAHTYDLFMYEDDERIFCDGAYFVSTDTDVVYYDYTTDRLVANDNGSAYVYVYTKGGVPFFRLNVSVINKLGSKYSIVDLVPDEWHLDGAGDTTDFTINSSKYDEEDFQYSIVHGNNIASITKDGKLKVTGTGPIVVRASLKTNANVYGEALLYAGQYISSFYDGYYTKTGNKYVTNYWGYDYDIGDVRDCYINGWIKSKEGILVPVLKKSTGTVVNSDGSTRETTVVSYGNVSVADLIRDAYGDKDDLYDIIKKYNLFKGKDYTKTVVTYDDFDYIRYILSQAWDD